MTSPAYFALGRFAGQQPRLLRVGDHGDVVQVGGRLERLTSASRFETWDAFRRAATASGGAERDWYIDRCVAAAPGGNDPAEAAADAADRIDALVADGLLINANEHGREHGEGLTGYSLLAVMSPADLPASGGVRRRVGIPGVCAVALSDAEFRIWTLLPQIADLAELADLLVLEDLLDGGSTDRYGATVRQVAALAAKGVASLDAVS